MVVIGGSGFVGAEVVARLAAQNRNVLVPTRRREQARHLILLPTVDVIEADVHDPAVLRQLIEGQDAVINLVGVLHGDQGIPYGRAFARAHVELPGKIVAACKQTGVTRVLHMSALGAAADAPSMYLRSKADGEAVVLGETGLQASVFRPSVIFGPGDQFLNLFAALQKWFPVIPLAGADALFQPVCVDDVANAIVAAIDLAEAVGQTIELAGPRVYTLRELVALAGQYSGHRRLIIGLPAGLGRLQARVMEWLPGPTLMSRDNVDSMRVPNVASHPPDPALARALGFSAPLQLEQVAPEYLSEQAHHGRFDHYRRGAGR